MMNNDVITLQNIAQVLETTPNASQRTLAEQVGMSVGLMNAVLKRFVERGWIMLSNVNKRKLSYALTAAGAAELAERTRAFARRTFQIAHDYNKAVRDLVESAKTQGKSKIVLLGESYITFLLEYACTSAGIALEKREAAAQSITGENALFIAGELSGKDDTDALCNLGAINLLDAVQSRM